MSRYRFLARALLGGAMVLAVAQTSQAQVVVGVGVGFGGPRYAGYGRYYGYPGYYGYYPRAYGVAVYQPVYVMPVAPVYSAAPAYSVVPSAATPANSATVQVLVPDANAEVWMEGQKMPSNGSATRVYASPALEPGKNYTYSVTATWFQNGKIVKQERSVPISAGATQVVDFRKGGPGTGIEGLPMPAPAATK